MMKNLTKKGVGLLLVLCLLVSVIGCATQPAGSTSAESVRNSQTEESQSASKNDSKPNEQSKSEESKTEASETESSGEAEPVQDSSVPVEQDSSNEEPLPEESKQEAREYTISDEVVVDNDYCRVTITKAEVDSYDNVRLKVLCDGTFTINKLAQGTEAIIKIPAARVKTSTLKKGEK